MSGSSVSFLVLYVDNILLIGNDVIMLNNVKEYLNNNFSMKDMGEAAYVLGIKIYRDRTRRLLALGQSTYLDKVLKRFKMENSKKGDLPVVKGTSLSVTQSLATGMEKSVMSSIPYASAICSIMYAMLSTKPDVALALSLSRCYQSNPGMSHWTAVKNILKFLRRTKDMVLVYGGSNI
jgi:ATP-binding cassette subfamily B (MDR/TAP) protein 1